MKTMRGTRGRTRRAHLDTPLTSSRGHAPPHSVQPLTSEDPLPGAPARARAWEPRADSRQARARRTLLVSHHRPSPRSPPALISSRTSSSTSSALWTVALWHAAMVASERVQAPPSTCGVHGGRTALRAARASAQPQTLAAPVHLGGKGAGRDHV